MLSMHSIIPARLLAVVVASVAVLTSGAGAGAGTGAYAGAGQAEDAAVLGGPRVGTPFPMWLSPGVGPNMRARLMRQTLPMKDVKSVLTGLAGDDMPRDIRLTRAQVDEIDAIEKAYKAQVRAVRKETGAAMNALRRERNAVRDSIPAIENRRERARAQKKQADLEQQMAEIREAWPQLLDLYRRWWLVLTPAQSREAAERLRVVADERYLSPKLERLDGAQYSAMAESMMASGMMSMAELAGSMGAASDMPAPMADAAMEEAADRRWERKKPLPSPPPPSMATVRVPSGAGTE